MGDAIRRLRRGGHGVGQLVAAAGLRQGKRTGRNSFGSLFGKSLLDAVLDHLVPLIPRGFVVLRIVLDLRFAFRRRLLHGGLIGVGLRAGAKRRVYRRANDGRGSKPRNKPVHATALRLIRPG